VDLPFTRSLTPSNSLNPRGAINPQFLIPTVLLVSSLSKIIATIVKSVTVSVIRAALNAKHEVVHPNPASHYPSFSVFMNGTYGIEKSTTSDFRMPLPLIQPIKIGFVNDGNFTPREWNEAVGWKRQHNSLWMQVGHYQPSKAVLMCCHFTLSEIRHAGV
jgi:hypothetical protein